MTTLPPQRVEALRLADELDRIGEHGIGSLITTTGEVWHPANTMLPAAALLRELAAMRCPEDGGLCGAGGYCRPQQRQPLTEQEILDGWRDECPPSASIDVFVDGVVFAERAHGIVEAP